MSKNIKIAVIGGGINGLASAVRLKEKYPNAKITIFSDKFSPETTGDGSGGLWYPYLCGDTPPELISDWGIQTYKYLHSKWLEGGIGLSLMPTYVLERQCKNSTKPIWVDHVFGYNDMNKKELEYFSDLYSGNFVEGHYFTTIIVPPTKMLSYLLEEFTKKNGVVKKMKILSLEDEILKEFDVIVNCTGLGAKELVGDHLVQPIRGQVLRVKADFINQSLMDHDRGLYLIPNDENVVLGGTGQVGDYRTEPNEKDTKFIVEGCHYMVPGLKSSKVLSNWAGLRPGRQTIRLETEIVSGKPVVHNYGHGGSGLTLFWGCAAQVQKLVENHLKQLL